MPRLVLFGPGYTGSRIAAALETRGWEVTRVGRATAADEARSALDDATHALSTVAPILPGTGRGTAGEAGGGGGPATNAAPTGEVEPLRQPAAGPPPRAGEDFDPVLAAYAPLLARVPWLGYLSSTGVYGDTGGAWVDESAPLAGRRAERIAADRTWLTLGARVFRLPGIYGPGRSVLDRLAEGRAHRIDLPGQVFSRIHVDDIVAGVLAAIERGPAGAYSLADDLPASQNDVVEEACRLAGLSLPPLQTLAEARLGPMARAFYDENRRVAAGKAHRMLGWRPLYATYRAGLRALIATSSPASVSAAPVPAVGVQRYCSNRVESAIAITGTSTAT